MSRGQPTNSRAFCARGISRSCAIACATVRRAISRRSLGDLGLEDQVVVFRLLPRRTAAATFEYLSLDAQEALLKAMAQEDVAALLNDMAPDDRTMFLEELPAPVTRQLLALLTPEERSVAVALLGYPEGSIGRLMTPTPTSPCARTGPSGGARLHPHERSGQRNAQRRSTWPTSTGC